MNKSPKSRSGITKLVVRILVLSLSGAFLGLQIYLINAERLVGNAMPMPFDIGASVVLSGSMEPELSVDDLIIVKKQDHYDIGDVVVFQSHGSLVVHRIISIDGKMVTTQGDANPSADDPIEMDNIKGVVVRSIPKIGAVVSFLKTPVGIIVVIGAAVLLMELSFRNEKKKDSDELEAIKDEIRRLKEGIDNKDTK